MAHTTISGVTSQEKQKIDDIKKWTRRDFSKMVRDFIHSEHARLAANEKNGERLEQHPKKKRIQKA